MPCPPPRLPRPSRRDVPDLDQPPPLARLGALAADVPADLARPGNLRRDRNRADLLVPGNHRLQPNLPRFDPLDPEVALDRFARLHRSSLGEPVAQLVEQLLAGGQV